MNWLSKLTQQLEFPGMDIQYPLAGSTVSGLTVLEDIDNISSISASFYDWEILDGIREIPVSDFNTEIKHNFYARNDRDHCWALAEEIRQSGEIMPLIVVMDAKTSGEGPYILEGGHRLVALGLLGVSSFPALVVIDKDDQLSTEVPD